MVLIGLKYLKLMKILLKTTAKIVIRNIFLEVDVKYPEQLHKLHNDLPFLPEGMKILKK